MNCTGISRESALHFNTVMIIKLSGTSEIDFVRDPQFACSIALDTSYPWRRDQNPCQGPYYYANTQIAPAQSVLPRASLCQTEAFYPHTISVSTQRSVNIGERSRENNGDGNAFLQVRASENRSRDPSSLPPLPHRHHVSVRLR